MKYTDCTLLCHTLNRREYITIILSAEGHIREEQNMRDNEPVAKKLRSDGKTPAAASFFIKDSIKKDAPAERSASPEEIFTPPAQIRPSKEYMKYVRIAIVHRGLRHR